VLTRRLRRLRSQVTALHSDHRLLTESDNYIRIDSVDYDDELGALAKAYDELNAQLAEQYEALQHSDRGRRELFANISHDLRTPLTALSGYLETLQLKLQDRDRDLQSYADIAYRQSLKLRELVAQLLELSTINSGELKPQPEVFSLLELVHDIAQDFQIELASKNLRLQVMPSSHSNELFNVEADISLIQRVFENLLTNAIEHTPEHGDICIELREDSRYIQVGIADSGTGMSEQQIAKIFSRFHSGHNPDRLPANRNEGQKHAGLGLAIVKGILDLHHCTIDVSSQTDVGTRFDFWLPATPEHDYLPAI